MLYGNTDILKDCLNKIQKETEHNYTGLYILPSSIHELIIIPDDGRTNDKDYMKQMVRDINRSELKPEEVLSDNVFYFDDKGYAYCNKWLKDKDNKWYYFDEGCYMLRDKWLQDGGKWYRLGSDGAMLTGWFKGTNDKWSYLDIEKGYAYKSCTILIDGKYYSFDENCYWIENNGGVSDSLVDFIKGYEGYFDHWYDAGDGYDTIGYGTATSGKVGQRLKSQGITSCTESQATGWLKEEINNMAASITEKLNAARITLKQCQFDALASFAYNCGTYSLFNSTLWRYVISNRPEADIQSAFLMWNKCNGRVLKGLTKRRQAEANMYNYGVYDSTH